MNQKEKSNLTRKKILETAGVLFLKKGFEASTMQDIVSLSGLSKGAIYHHFKSKEEIMNALGDQMFFDKNPFDAVRERTDLNGLQKIRELLLVNHMDSERESLNAQAVPILSNARILAAAVEANRRVLTPLWFELLEEGRQDGSIHTEYTRELAELLPLVNFWLMPSVFPASAEEIRHKFLFIIEALEKMGLPLLDEGLKAQAEEFLSHIAPPQ